MAFPLKALNSFGPMTLRVTTTMGVKGPSAAAFPARTSGVALLNGIGKDANRTGGANRMSRQDTGHGGIMAVEPEAISLEGGFCVASPHKKQDNSSG